VGATFGLWGSVLSAAFLEREREREGERVGELESCRVKFVRNSFAFDLHTNLSRPNMRYVPFHVTATEYLVLQGNVC